MKNLGEKRLYYGLEKNCYAKVLYAQTNAVKKLIILDYFLVHKKIRVMSFFSNQTKQAADIRLLVKLLLIY